MIAEITTGGNSPKVFDRHQRGNSHAVDLGCNSKTTVMLL